MSMSKMTAAQCCSLHSRCSSSRGDGVKMSCALKLTKLVNVAQMSSELYFLKDLYHACEMHMTFLPGFHFYSCVRGPLVFFFITSE